MVQLFNLSSTLITQLLTLLQYNLLTEVIQEPPKSDLFLWLLRLAFIGFVASVISDSVSNSLRVIKTYRQVNDTKVSYGKTSPVFHLSCSMPYHFTEPIFTGEAVRLVVRDDGVSGLLGRGLTTRILSNGLQGLLFSILWKLFLDM